MGKRAWGGERGGNNRILGNYLTLSMCEIGEACTKFIGGGGEGPKIVL